MSRGSSHAALPAAKLPRRSAAPRWLTVFVIGVLSAAGAWLPVDGAAGAPYGPSFGDLIVQAASGTDVTASGSGFEPNARVRGTLISNASGELISEVWATSDALGDASVTLPFADETTGPMTVAIVGPMPRGGNLELAAAVEPHRATVDLARSAPAAGSSDRRAASSHRSGGAAESASSAGDAGSGSGSMGTWAIAVPASAAVAVVALISLTRRRRLAKRAGD